MFSIRNFFVIFFFLITLVGCNSSDDDSDDVKPPKESVIINAQDVLSFAPTKDVKTVDLRQRVSAENGHSLIINTVESIDNNCYVSSIDGLTFNVHTNGVSVCRFKYSVKPASINETGFSEAIAQVVSTDDYIKGDYLPPISRTMSESSTLTLDKDDLLIETGFDIDPNSIYLIGETESGDVGNVETDGNSIIYTSPDDTTGIVRVFYSERNVDSTIVKPGVIYIAIGQKNNTNPQANDAELEPMALTDIKREISVKDLISDLDKDSLKLIDIKSILGSTTINSNDSFIYTPSISGKEVLTYIISDHNGGYGIGSIVINIDEYHSITDPNQNLIFSPPFTNADVEMRGGIFSAQFGETGLTGNSGDYPTFEKKLAESYCTIQGKTLSSLSALQAMRTNILNDEPVYHTKYKWHSGVGYLTADSDPISLDTGEVAPIDPELGYFSCTKSTTDLVWKFLSPYYGARFDSPVSIYIGAETAAETSYFLPTNEYDLHVEVESLNVFGAINPPEEASKYITIQVKGNKITVSQKPGLVKNAVNVTLAITDPHVDDQVTRVVLGVTTCPNNIDPVLADRLGCIATISFVKNNELLTTSLSNTILTTLDVDPDSIEGEKVGKGSTTFQQIDVSEKDEDGRRKWINQVNAACETLNDINFSGRSNWQSYVSNIADKAAQGEVLGNLEDSLYGMAFAKWLAAIIEDQAPMHTVKIIGKPKELDYFTQSVEDTFFVEPFDSWNYLNPSCWSPN